MIFLFAAPIELLEKLKIGWWLKNKTRREQCALNLKPLNI
jgi:hypothetical protein